MGNAVALTEQENTPPQRTQNGDSQRSLRRTLLTGRALEAIGHIAGPTQNGSNHCTDIDSDSKA